MIKHTILSFLKYTNEKADFKHTYASANSRAIMIKHTISSFLKHTNEKEDFRRRIGVFWKW